MKHFVTFGSDHKDKHGESLAEKYLPMEGETYGQIREKIFAVRGDKFCTDYHWGEVAQFRQKYRMTEVSLEDAIITDITVEEFNEKYAPTVGDENVPGMLNANNIFKNQCAICNHILTELKNCPNKDCPKYVSEEEPIDGECEDVTHVDEVLAENANDATAGNDNSQASPSSMENGGGDVNIDDLAEATGLNPNGAGNGDINI